LPTGSRGYLVDAPISLHYLLAERDLVEPRAEPHGHSLLALGAPDFDRVDRAAASIGAVQQTLAQAITQAPPTNRVNTRSACESFATRTFAPLPATREEMQQIAQLWRQGGQGGAVAGDRADQQVVMLGDDRASEAAFKALAPGRRVLHLATHGFFLDRTCRMEPAGARGLGRTTRLLDESPLLRSGLVLAGANQRANANSDDEDGILTAEEIAGLDLSETQWAVLSACDTGRGDWQPSEGVLGLRRALDVAGARTVILSLWPVIDTVASQWMTELYRAKFVRNAGTAMAVRTASRTLLAARRTAGQSTHPLYWSGFIATGDWR
jgi:CHAT domain-containing protein